MADTPVVYWDASAVLSALFSDSHSQSAKKWANINGLHLISTFAYAEVCAVIARMIREKVLPKKGAKAAFEILEKGPWRKIAVHPEWQMMRSLSAKWPLRSADLWHLTAAKSLVNELPELAVLTFDKRLQAAAKRTGTRTAETEVTSIG